MSYIAVSGTAERSKVRADTLLDTLSGDRDIAGQVAQVFLAEVPAQYAALADAVGHLDCRTAADAAHKLRGSVGIFGESDALTAARELERAARAGDSVELVSLASQLRGGLTELTEAAGVFLRCCGDHESARGIAAP